jgi:hypothetical protein
MALGPSDLSLCSLISLNNLFVASNSLVEIDLTKAQSNAAELRIARQNMKRSLNSGDDGHKAKAPRRQDPVSCQFCRTKKLKVSFTAILYPKGCALLSVTIPNVVQVRSSIPMLKLSSSEGLLHLSFGW